MGQYRRTAPKTWSQRDVVGEWWYSIAPQSQRHSRPPKVSARGTWWSEIGTQVPVQWDQLADNLPEGAPV
jgi:hypothetical protein